MKESRLMIALELTEMGDSVGVILPKGLLTRFNLKKGDTVFVTEAGQGVLMLMFHDVDLETQMSAARRIMKERHQVLRELTQ